MYENVVFVNVVFTLNFIVIVLGIVHCNVFKNVFELINCRWEEPWVGQRGTFFPLSNNKIN